MKTQVLKKQSADDKDEVHRLTDFVIEEVSLVDRPANMQPFLVVKRADGGDSQIVQNKDGELVVDKSGTDKADKAGDNDEFLRLLQLAKSSIGDAEKSAGSDMKKAGGLVDTAVSNLQKARSYADDRKSAEKAGAKISGRRLEQLSQAIDSLTALKDDLIPKKKDPKDSAETKKATNDDDGVAAGFDPTEVFKRMDKLNASVDKICGVVKDQEQRIRKNADSVSTRDDEAVVSNRIDVDKGQIAEPVEKTHWPMDLNREETLENTPKHISFFGD